ncbi:phytoene desaturase family protein [Pedobacter duraquae]|uniref:Phytoene desaturase n=1 Tax=Pedobacter duraquae TaxID=425511 RepID=A0A4V3C410_9SPHI|nr:phytoene desaturase family protein [Pedobacter duraquae]TDO24138.1 phytoene desaturase [Pedobacter duraquae]
MAKISIIGSGFSGLSAACFAARDGHEVTVFEKNSGIGGRARTYEAAGFTFDMGPSWYWMPDIFEHFFNQFGKSAADYYQLKKLDPGFQLIFPGKETLEVPANLDALYATFESIEPGSSKSLTKFLKEAEFKYKIGMKELVYKPAFSWMEYANKEVIVGMLKSNIFSSVSSYVRKYFKDPRLIALLEFPVLFLGAMANKIPALYTMMNYSALVQGTWYPEGGMHKIIEGMYELAVSLGVKFKTGLPVTQLKIAGDKVYGLETSEGIMLTDGVIASADYNHVEQHLLEEQYRNYTPDYWDKKTFAPSCLIFYLGVNKEIPNLHHHNLFFDADLDQHAKEIYATPQWPTDPLFYVCCPSKTDPTVAPKGMENLFILVPIATALKDTEEIRESYFKGIIKRIEDKVGVEFLADIIYKRSYCLDNFVTDYNAFGGNAYGLANTLMQTAVLKPSLKNHKVGNLFYTGQLTVPGPGVPPALISGQVAAAELIKSMAKEMIKTA